MKTMKERMLTGDLYIPSLTEGLRDLSIKGKKLAQHTIVWTSMISKEDAHY